MKHKQTKKAHYHCCEDPFRHSLLWKTDILTCGTQHTTLSRCFIRASKSCSPSRHFLPSALTGNCRAASYALRLSSSDGKVRFSRPPAMECSLLHSTYGRLAAISCHSLYQLYLLWWEWDRWELDKTDNSDILSGVGKRRNLLQQTTQREIDGMGICWGTTTSYWHFWKDTWLAEITRERKNSWG